QTAVSSLLYHSERRQMLRPPVETTPRPPERPHPRDGMTRRTFLTVSGTAMVVAAENSGRVRDLPFRQVHLDFHTGPWIPDVGRDFDASEFLGVLQKARVNSINVFAKCQHGYAYYDTAIAAKHPSLKIDLLGGMIGALRPAGIAVNYYYCLTWDALAASRHPEWRILDRDGKPVIFGGHN